jgi:hypothetical protein
VRVTLHVLAGRMLGAMAITYRGGAMNEVPERADGIYEFRGG